MSTTFIFKKKRNAKPMPPRRNFAELAIEFGISEGELHRCILKNLVKWIEPAFVHGNKNHSMAWYDRAAAHAWWKAYQKTAKDAACR